jgi:succinate dehydrogenase / fumarate reductase, iron-sulfur subunit
VKLTLRIWRQASPDAKGKMQKYTLDDVEPDMSFLEMLDVLNEKLQLDGKDPVSFDHDCREGICGSCAMVINGTPHGPQ